MSFHVRLARSEDASALAEVLIATWRSTYRGIVPDAFLDELSVDASTERWKSSLSENESHTYVAEDEAGVFGFASGGKLREPLAEYDGELWALYVSDAGHRRGTGRELVHAVAGHLVESGYQSMLVWVLQQNPAVGFYRRIGGKAVSGKMIEIGGVALPDLALGWKDLSKVG
jgi:GNAT superfamily N-acetyltransferase